MHPVPAAILPGVAGVEARKAPRPIYDIAKRCMDITVAGTMLAILSPFAAAIALAIRLDSPGPAVFKQERVGRDKRRFTMYKFRSMRTDADPAIHQAYVEQWALGKAADGEGKSAVFKITTDPRITRVGRWLRKTSVDELPQLLNVLKGDMSLIGPRPALGYELKLYRPWQERRFEALPGLTGLWQVTGRSKVSFEGMVRLDLLYLRRRSLWLDIKILLQTPRAVFSGEGAY